MSLIKSCSIPARGEKNVNVLTGHSFHTHDVNADNALLTFSLGLLRQWALSQRLLFHPWRPNRGMASVLVGVEGPLVELG